MCHLMTSGRLMAVINLILTLVEFDSLKTSLVSGRQMLAAAVVVEAEVAHATVDDNLGSGSARGEPGQNAGSNLNLRSLPRTATKGNASQGSSDTCGASCI